MKKELRTATESEQTALQRAKLAVKKRNKMKNQLDDISELCDTLRGYRSGYREQESKLAGESAKVPPH